MMLKRVKLLQHVLFITGFSFPHTSFHAPHTPLLTLEWACEIADFIGPKWSHVGNLI